MTATRTFTHAELHKSALNVRTNVEDAEATSALEASIAAHGLLETLAVHPTGPDAPTPWGVLAGGRRLLAIGRLIEAGRLPADWPIPTRIFSGTEAELIEISLSENLLRRGLRQYEIHAAIKAAVDQGDDVATIAASLGQPEKWVKQNLRLGNLAAPIFAAYVAGDLSLEQASAYAATEDAELQQQVYDSLRNLQSWYHTPAHIRASLKVGDQDAARLLLFVGEAVYLGAGGFIERDLFDDTPHARIRIVDEDLLRKLADERLDVERQRIRKEAERDDLRFAALPPQFSGRTDEALEIRVAPAKLGAKKHPTDAIVATIEIDREGQPFTRIWWANRAAKGAAEKGSGQPTPNLPPAAVGANVNAGEAIAMPDSGYAQHGRAIVKDEYGLTGDGLHLIRSLRRALLRCALIEQGGSVATDYLVWAQARAVVGQAIASQTGMRRLVDEWNDSGGDREPPGLWKDFAGDLRADMIWRSEVAALKASPFMTEKDPRASLEMFLALPIGEKHLVAAIVAGAALLRSADTPGFRIAAHDVVARACGADRAQLRRWWVPTRQWLGLFGKMFRLAAAEPFVDAATRAGWSRLKDGDVAAAAAIAVDPTSHSDDAQRALAARWLPDLVAFGPDAAPPPEPEPPNVSAQLPDLVAEERKKLKSAFRGRANPARVREAIQ